MLERKYDSGHDFGAVISGLIGIAAYHYQLWERKNRLKPIYGAILFTELKQNLIALAKEKKGEGVFIPSFWASQSLELAAILPEDEIRKYQKWIYLVLQKPLKSYVLNAVKEIDYDYIIDEGYKVLDFFAEYSPCRKTKSKPVKLDITYKWMDEDSEMDQRTDTKDKK